MAIQILGADGLTVLKVDTPSQAARVTLYDQYGNPMSDVNSLGNVLNALNAAVTLTLGGQGTAGFAVTGTTGTITLAFEYTIDSTNWFALAVTPVAGGSTVTTTSVNGQWVASVAGFYGVRARVSAITGGASMTVSMTLGPEMSKQVAQAITTAGALTVEISDGTNGPANVTPPSTPASAAEEALVVALSPNSPLPTGSNVIGALTANQSVNLTEIDGTTTVTGGEAGSLGVGGLAASGSAVVGNPVLVAGSDGTDARAILTDTSGRPEVVGAAASGSAVVGNPVLVAGSDGTDARTITTDASGHPVVVGDGTAGSPAGGVVSVQGVSGGQAVPVSGTVTATVTGTVTSNQGTANTVANSWPVEITDGTNVLGTAAHPVRVDPTGTTTQPVSGSVTVTQSTPSNLQGEVGGLAASGSPPVGNPVLVAGSDGTDARTIATDASGHPVVVGDGTAGTPAGGVVSVQGVSGGQAVPISGSVTATVTGSVTANQGTPNTEANAWPMEITDGTHGPAAVKAASVQAVAADPALTVSVSPNSISAKDRTNIGFGTQQLAPVAGSDNGIARILRASESGTIRTTSEIMLWHDAFEGATVNAFWTQSTTTQTIAQAVGVLTLNNSNITTLNTDSIITSQRQFPKYPRNPLFVRFRALITANVAANHTFVEMGLGAPSGVTAIINNGAFFRWTSAGNLNAVVSYNGTETSTQILAQGLISTTSYLYYDVFIDDDYARFIVSDSSGTPIVDTQLDIALTAPFISAVSHLPVFARVYVDATGGGTAVQLKLSAHSVQLVDGLFNTSFGEQMAYSMRSSIINPTTYAQTPQLAAGAAPATITPNNTGSTAYTTLGGEYAVALTAGSENLLGIFAFTIPTPYSFVLTNLTWQTPVVTTAISVTGIPFIEWAVIINATSVSPSTGGGFRFNPGLGFAYTAITQAAGVACTLAGNNNWLPQAPIICLPGTVLILAYKVLVTTAAGTPGVTRGSVYVGGYFK